MQPRSFKPLAGFSVLDLSRLYPGPLCSLVLAHLGAEVVKVEDPQGGDYMRWWPPLVEGLGAAFHALNRGKKSVTLDLKTPADRAAFLSLCKGADGVLESFRPGVLERLGVGYDALVAANPRVVLCSISGYGQRGPRSGEAGHDINFMAIAGVLHTTGVRGGAPVVPGFQATDFLTGMYAATGLAAALPEARASGRPRWLDVAMADVALSLGMLDVASSSAAGADRARGRNLLNGGAPIYGIYETSDGAYFAVGAIEEKFHVELLERLYVPRELKEDALTPGGRLEKALRAAFGNRTRAEIEAIFAGTDALVSPILRPTEAAALPLFLERGMLDASAAPGIPIPLVPLSETGLNPGALGPAPKLGEHNDEILGRLKAEG
ncbi:MAG: CoA transferase [Deltaproteobacteria bacterium]|nr:CoA transferase [Deltaproteobacteria bacterium]